MSRRSIWKGCFLDAFLLRMQKKGEFGFGSFITPESLKSFYPFFLRLREWWFSGFFRSDSRWSAWIFLKFLSSYNWREGCGFRTHLSSSACILPRGFFHHEISLLESLAPAEEAAHPALNPPFFGSIRKRCWGILKTIPWNFK